MLSREQNDLITQTGPGTPGGDMFRRYWHPVLLSDELPPGGDPVPIDILGEELVAFRDEQDRIGLLDRHCCHRGADISYGRLENGGIRCLYHGWLFDVNGQCLEQPAEPPGSTFKDKVCQQAYSTHEAGGAIFAYMGPGEAPEFPAYEYLNMREGQYSVYKVFEACNYHQANEGNIDPVHVGFLHRNFDADNPFTLHEATPELEVEETDFGFRLYQMRPGPEGKKNLRITNFCLPDWSIISGPQGGDGYIAIWHVPVDDHSHWRWGFAIRRDITIAPDGTPSEEIDFRSRHSKEFTPERHFVRNAGNRYHQDRAKMKTDNFNGMGPNFNVHDAFASESQGSISDRTKEHLASSDAGVICARQQLLEAVAAVQRGAEPRGVVRDPAKNDFRHLDGFDVLIDADADPFAFVAAYLRGRAEAAE